MNNQMNNQNQPVSSADKQPVVPQEQQPVQPQPKKPRPKWLIPVIVIVGVVVLGLIVWGAYELFKPAPPEEPVTEDETTNWETYQNEEYGFEAKYPENWTVEYISRYYEELEVYYEVILFDNSSREYRLSLNIVPEDSNKIVNLRTGYRAGDIIETDQTVNIGGVDVGISELIYEGLVHEIFFNPFKVTGFRGEAKLSYLGDEDLNKFTMAGAPEVNVAKKILESFKFLEPNETVEWKSYQNEEYGFELKYPKDWKAIENRQSYIQVSFLPISDTTGFNYIDIRIEDNPNDLNERDWIKEKEGDRYSMLVAQSEDIEIGGETGLLIKDQPEMVSYRVVYISKDKKMYQISIAKNSSYVEIFNQILSTFKFLPR